MHSLPHLTGSQSSYRISKSIMRMTIRINTSIQNLRIRGLSPGNAVHPFVQRILGILQFLPAGVQVGLGLFDLAGQL